MIRRRMGVTITILLVITIIPQLFAITTTIMTIKSLGEPHIFGEARASLRVGTNSKKARQPTQRPYEGLGFGV